MKEVREQLSMDNLRKGLDSQFDTHDDEDNLVMHGAKAVPFSRGGPTPAKAYRVDAYAATQAEAEPSLAVFEVNEQLARVIVDLSLKVRELNVYKIERFDRRCVFLQHDPQTEPEAAELAGVKNIVRVDCEVLAVMEDLFFFRAHVEDMVTIECEYQSVKDLADHFGIPFVPRNGG